MGYHQSIPSHIPFWSEVIPQVYGIELVSANSSITLTIQPPTDETWLIYIHGVIESEVSNSMILSKQYTTSSKTDWLCKIGGTYGLIKPNFEHSRILKNDNYLQVEFWNKDTSSGHYARWGYSGFKLGTKIAEFEEMKTIESIQRERLTKYKIKSEFEGLEDLIRDVYDDTTDDYKQVIYFYKDKPIRKDKATGHIIEKASSYIETDKLIENLGKVKTGELKLEKTGYKSWLDKIKKERGIDLLVRL